MTETTPTLTPQTREAREALQTDEVRLDRFPFRVGRESRFGLVRGQWRSMERRQLAAPPNNDLYLVDTGDVLNISREHFNILLKDDGSYALVDHNSTCGTIVDDTNLGVDCEQTQCDLKDGSTLIVGTQESPYKFTFNIGQAAS